jgi:protein required for attachment to host cells
MANSKVKIAQGEWVVVCDGKKALVLENVGDEKFPNLKTREVHEQEAPPARELGTDEPGRSIQSATPMRSAMEQTDFHDQAERAFLEKLIRRLDQAVLSGTPKHLIVVAPPRALGVIRQAYSKQLRGAIKAEIDKDFVRMPVDQIEKHLAA